MSLPPLPIGTLVRIISLLETTSCCVVLVGLVFVIQLRPAFNLQQSSCLTPLSAGMRRYSTRPNLSQVLKTLLLSLEVGGSKIQGLPGRVNSRPARAAETSSQIKCEEIWAYILLVEQMPYHVQGLHSVSSVTTMNKMLRINESKIGIPEKGLQIGVLMINSFKSIGCFDEPAGLIQYTAQSCVLGLHSSAELCVQLTAKVSFTCASMDLVLRCVFFFLSGLTRAY